MSRVLFFCSCPNIIKMLEISAARNAPIISKHPCHFVAVNNATCSDSLGFCFLMSVIIVSSACLCGANVCELTFCPLYIILDSCERSSAAWFRR